MNGKFAGDLLWLFRDRKNFFSTDLVTCMTPIIDSLNNRFVADESSAANEF